MTTSASLNQSGGGSITIPNLVAQVAAGSVRIPSFQRAFVWDAKDVRDLFDSIYRGFPIGTLLLWRHQGPAGIATVGPVTLTVAADVNTLWVIDGQQRIASLFAALSSQYAGLDDRFEVYFDLATEKFVNPRRGAVARRWIPLREALETRSLLHWLRDHGDDLESVDFDLADRLGGTLRDYRIPAYVVTGDDQALLREVFDRVNSAGKPITRAQVFHALFGGDSVPGSPRSVIAGLRSLGFGDLDESRVVQSLLAIRGGNVQRDIHDEFTEGEDPADWYDRVELALVRAIEFLRSQGVPHLLLLPNGLPVPVLAAFFHLHPSPDPWIRRLLARWLWRGWLHGFGESGQTPALRQAIRSVNPVHRSPGKAPPVFDAVKALLEQVPDRDPPPVRLDDFRTDSAAGRLMLLAMASLAPMDADGNVLDLAAELQAHGVGAVTDLVRGNRTLVAARGYWPAGSTARLADVADERVLGSHAVTLAAAASLRNGDAAGFVAQRGAELQRLLHNFLNSRTEPTALVRPPLRDLALTGAAEDVP